MIQFKRTKKLEQEEEVYTMNEAQLRAKVKRRAKEMKYDGLRPWLARHEKLEGATASEEERYRKLLYVALENLWEY